MTASTIKRIIVKYEKDGDTKEMVDALKRLSDSAKSTSSSVDTLKRTVLGLVGAFGLQLGIKGLFEMADSLQGLRERIKAIQGPGTDTNDVIESLRSTANKTKSDIGTLAYEFNKLSIVTRTLGVTNEGAVAILEQLHQTFRISGTDAEQASNSMNQLVRAFETGTVKGRELKALMVSDPFLISKLRSDLGSSFQTALKDGIPVNTLLATLNKHFVEINETSSKLKQTFSETVTVLKNELTVEVDKLNQKLGASEGFAKIGRAAVNILHELDVVFEQSKIYKFVNAFNSMLDYIGKNASASDISRSPFIRFLALASDRTEHIAKQKKDMIAIDETYYGVVSKGADGLGRAMQFLGEKFNDKNIEKYGTQLQTIAKSVGKAKTSTQDYTDELIKMQKEAAKNNLPVHITYLKPPPSLPEQIKAVELQIGSLNTEYNKGDISVTSYNKKIVELTQKLDALKIKTGSLSTSKAREEMEKLNRANLGREFESGAIKIDEYNKRLNQLKLAEVTQKMNEGKISALQYHQEILKLSSDFQPGSALYVGVNSYIESSGTLSQNIAKNITLVFNTLEDTLVDFIKTGTFEFAKFTQAILDDLTRVIVRAAIIQPLAQTILGSFGGENSLSVANANAGGSNVHASPNVQNAMGGAWNNGVQFYAKGGVFDSPTMFQHSNGLGVLGESGPEAVLPLTRKGGKLGVGATPVTVNIINNSGAEVTKTESQGPNGERILEVLIASKTREIFANGTMDKTMRQVYGLNRRGS